jgi:hypothetical protein
MTPIQVARMTLEWNPVDSVATVNHYAKVYCFDAAMTAECLVEIERLKPGTIPA